MTGDVIFSRPYETVHGVYSSVCFSAVSMSVSLKAADLI